jgi:hypothetical protein
MALVRGYPAGVRLGALTIAGLCALVLGACGDTVQQKPIPHNILEGLIAAAHPVYWLGGSFRGLQIVEASHDPGGAYSIEYGNCRQGGQGTCVPPLRIITSPDNSFLPRGSGAAGRASIRGAAAVSAQSGRTLVVPTADVVVDIYATDRTLASAAAEAMVPINAVGVPGGPLPAALPDSGFGEAPLPSQVPSPVHPLG